MARSNDITDETPFLSDNYVKVDLPVDAWVAVAIPKTIRIIRMGSSKYVIVRQATNDVVPTEAPNGVGSVALHTFAIADEITHLHLYGAESTLDTAYLNLYSGYRED